MGKYISLFSTSHIMVCGIVVLVSKSNTEGKSSIFANYKFVIFDIC